MDVVSWFLGVISALFVFYISYWHQKTEELRVVYERDISALKRIISSIKAFGEIIEDISRYFNKESEELMDEILSGKMSIKDLQDKIRNFESRLTMASANISLELLPEYLNEIISSLNRVSDISWQILENHNPELWRKKIRFLKITLSVNFLKNNQSFLIFALNYGLLSKDQKIMEEVLQYSLNSLLGLRKTLVDSGILKEIEKDIETLSFKEWKKIYSRIYGYRLYPFI